eukprot:2990804-Prymnesium_polylepis.1
MRDPARPCAAAASSVAAPAPASEGCQVVGPPTDHQSVANRLPGPRGVHRIACNKPRRGWRCGNFENSQPCKISCTTYQDTPQACQNPPDASLGPPWAHAPTESGFTVCAALLRR